jgi:diketogulonate reductase-like aldo/keto reductase
VDLIKFLAFVTMSRLSISSTYRLKSGFEIPLLGYGVRFEHNVKILTGRLINSLLQVFQTPPKIATSVVERALKDGYRHVDSAAFYQNEAGCAQAMLKSGIPREQLFFTSKVPPPGMSYTQAKNQVKRTLKEIGELGYIDLMLLHAPLGGSEGRLGAWKALVEAVEEGKIRSIGVSNYGVHVCFYVQRSEKY